jgi:serine protease Do
MRAVLFVALVGVLVSGCANMPPPGTEIGIISASPASVTVFGRSEIPGGIVLVGPKIPIATDQQMLDLAQSHCQKFRKDAIPTLSQPMLGARNTTYACVESSVRSDTPQPKQGKTSGTAFFVDLNGHMITNRHVVEGCNRVTVLSPNGEIEAKVVKKDSGFDLALLKVHHRPNAQAIFRAGPAIRSGEKVSVFGFPYFGVLSTGGSVTIGNISALSGLGDNSLQMQISNPVQPGNSGGPLLDSSGNLVGVVVSKLNAIKVAKVTGDIPQNINFAIKLSTVDMFLKAASISPMRGKSVTVRLEADIADSAKSFTFPVVCQR